MMLGMDRPIPEKPQADHLSLYLESELKEMRASWATLAEQSPPPPCWSWEQIGESLLNLTQNPVEELVVRGGLSGLVKQAQFKPPERILEELIRLVRASHDLLLERFAREMLEAEMP